MHHGDPVIISRTTFLSSNVALASSSTNVPHSLMTVITACVTGRLVDCAFRRPALGTRLAPSGLQSNPSTSSRLTKVVRQQPANTSNPSSGTQHRRIPLSGGFQKTPAGCQRAATYVITVFVLCTLAWPAESQAALQHYSHSEAFQLAEGDSDFWVNVSRYGRFFITVLLGTANISAKPFVRLLKRPKTDVALIVGVVALYIFVSSTVQAMLGVTNPLEYQPSGFFPDNY